MAAAASAIILDSSVEDAPTTIPEVIIEEQTTITIKNGIAIVNQIKELFSDEKTIGAFRLWESLQEFISQHKEKSQEEASDTDLLALESLIKENILLLNQIEREAKSVFDLMRELENDEGWVLSKQEDGITTWSQQIPGSPTCNIKMKGIIHSPIFDVLALINEVDLYKKWIPTCQDSGLDLSISNYKKMIRLHFAPPSPFNWVVSPRELMLYGYGVDMMDENKLIAMAKSPCPEELAYLKDEFDYTMTPEGTKQSTGFTRMHCHLAGLIFERISDTETQLSLLSNSDPMMFLPYSVINAVTKNFAPLIFVFLRKNAANLDAEYKQRIESNSIYDNIRERLA